MVQYGGDKGTGVLSTGGHFLPGNKGAPGPIEEHQAIPLQGGRARKGVTSQTNERERTRRAGLLQKTTPGAMGTARF